MTEQQGDAASESAGYRFLCGADMDPTAVLAAFPGAGFVARARLATGDAGEEVWGILIRVPAAVGTNDAEARPVVTDDGRAFRAVALGGGRPAGDPAAVLAAARFWELPPAYVRRLPQSPAGDR